MMKNWWKRFKEFWAPHDIFDDYNKILERQKAAAEQHYESLRMQARAELRDEFAKAALIGLLAAGDSVAFNREEMADEAWAQADAMMKARSDD